MSTVEILAAQGMSNRQIARELGLSEPTVRRHRAAAGIPPLAPGTPPPVSLDPSSPDVPLTAVVDALRTRALGDHLTHP